MNLLTKKWPTEIILYDRNYKPVSINIKKFLNIEEEEEIDEFERIKILVEKIIFTALFIIILLSIAGIYIIRNRNQKYEISPVFESLQNQSENTIDFDSIDTKNEVVMGDLAD